MTIDIERAGVCAVCGEPIIWQEAAEDRWLVHESNGLRNIMDPKPHVATVGFDPAVPPSARATDPDTSWDAADSVKPTKRKELQEAIVMILRRRPMTDEEIYKALTGSEFSMILSPSGTRTRRAELVRAGLVEWSGEKARISTGRLARVWMLQP